MKILIKFLIFFRHNFVVCWWWRNHQHDNDSEFKNPCRIRIRIKSFRIRNPALYSVYCEHRAVWTVRNALLTLCTSYILYWAHFSLSVLYTLSSVLRNCFPNTVHSVYSNYRVQRTYCAKDCTVYSTDCTVLQCMCCTNCIAVLVLSPAFFTFYCYYVSWTIYVGSFDHW